MPEPDAYYYDPATRFYDAASEEDQDELDRIVRNVCDNPGIDHQVKFWFQAPPAVFSLYADARFWLVYRQLSNFSIGILNIGHAGSIADWRG